MLKEFFKVKNSEFYINQKDKNHVDYFSKGMCSCGACVTLSEHTHLRHMFKSPHLKSI